MAYEVIRWITLAILWGCIALNVWTIVRNIRLHKRLGVERKYCTAMMSACDNYIKARQKELKSIVEEVSDDGEN